MSLEEFDLSARELAEVLGETQRTVERWGTDGCPRWQDATSGEWRYAGDQVRAWLAQQQRAGRKVGTGSGKRGGKAEPAAERVEDTELRSLIDTARSRAEVNDLRRRVARDLAGGRLSGGQGNSLRAILRDLEDSLATEAQQSRGSETLVSEGAKDLAEAFDALVSGERRARLRALLEQLLDEERAALNPEDPEQVRKALETAGLDAYGEPAEETPCPAP